MSVYGLILHGRRIEAGLRGVQCGEMKLTAWHYLFILQFLHLTVLSFSIPNSWWPQEMVHEFIDCFSQVCINCAVSLFKKCFVLFLIMFTCMSVCGYAWVQWPWRPKEGIRYPGDGGAGGGESRDMSAGSQPQSIWKSSVCPSQLSHHQPQPFHFGRKNHRYARYTFHSSGKNLLCLTSPSAKTEVKAFYLFHIRGGKLAESWSPAPWILLKPSLSKYCSQVNRLQGGAQELRDEVGFCTLVSLPNLSGTYSGGVAS